VVVCVFFLFFCYAMIVYYTGADNVATREDIPQVAHEVILE